MATWQYSVKNESLSYKRSCRPTISSINAISRNLPLGKHCVFYLIIYRYMSTNTTTVQNKTG